MPNQPQTISSSSTKWRILQFLEDNQWIDGRILAQCTCKAFLNPPPQKKKKKQPKNQYNITFMMHVKVP